MAPLITRQNHSLSPSAPGYGKGPSIDPVPVTKSIDPSVFGELFAGTIGIFVLAVLFWKGGKFMRSLNRHKVVREGKLTTTRYSRTWYGWVARETHERNKLFLRKLFKPVLRWMSWKSTQADYQWVWWNPGQEVMTERRHNGRRSKWLPEGPPSWNFPSADETRGLPIPIGCHGALCDYPNPDLLRPTEALRISGCSERNNDPQPRVSLSQTGREERGTSSTSQEMFTPPSISHQSGSDDQLDVDPSFDRRGPNSLPKLAEDSQSPSTPRSTRCFPQMVASQTDLRTYRTLHPSNCLHMTHSSFRLTEPGRCLPVKECSRILTQNLHPTRLGRYSQSRRHRGWSARMQIDAKKRHARVDLRDSSGPPGTPLTDLLASFLSEQSCSSVAIDRIHEDTRGAKSLNSSPFARIDHRHIRTEVPYLTSPKVVSSTNKYKSAPVRIRSIMSTEVLSVSPHNSPWHSWREIKRPKICGNLAHDVWEPATPVKTQCPPFFGPFDGSTVEITRRKDTLHDWEIRLVDRLDRKLGWMYNETTPGQKPYHFALLANHWLNRETWLVIDPVSRVPIHHRRQWGDPRFNVPYPEPGHNSRPKYPAAIRKRAQIPRIDAWRAAVNNQRRASGIRDVLRTVELYEDSAEEPPDGKIDPACWILPKPPQGFSMSTSQRNAWYEGGAGWQETLDNWQQVRRGYRLRKIIHEGRANRNRVKEIATQINRGSRITSLKLLPREREQTVHSSQAVPQ